MCGQTHAEQNLTFSIFALDYYLKGKTGDFYYLPCPLLIFQFNHSPEVCMCFIMHICMPVLNRHFYVEQMLLYFDLKFI